MSAFLQSIVVTSDFQTGNLSASFQPVCEAILQRDAPGFSHETYTNTCLAITSDIASTSMVDLTTRGVFLGAGVFYIAKGCSTIGKAIDRRTWSKTLGQATQGSIALAYGVAMTAYAILSPFDPISYDTGAAHDDLLAVLPH